MMPLVAVLLFVAGFLLKANPNARIQMSVHPSVQRTKEPISLVAILLFVAALLIHMYINLLIVGKDMEGEEATVIQGFLAVFL